MNSRKEWFETWFDSPYYHILYDHRNEEEAERFILRLKEHLDLSRSDKVLDLGCGAGRHAAFLSQYVGEAVGLDLSNNSISHALTTYVKPNLEFYTHDMRLPFRINYFDHILNFFTSFGYFKKMDDNIRVLVSAKKGLRSGGHLLIDFMNADKAKKELKTKEELVKQGVKFQIRREINDGKILKHIAFSVNDQSYNFMESVQAFSQDDFRNMAQQSGFEMIREFGDYELNSFDVSASPRYILLLRKP